jgi:hypothetical protein
MTSVEVRDLLRAAQEATARIGTAKALPSDRAIISNALRLFSADAMKLAMRKQMLAPKVIVDWKPEPNDEPVVMRRAEKRVGFKIDFSKKAG